MSLSHILDPSTANQSWKAIETYSLNTVNNVSVGGDLTVAGSSTFDGPVNFNINGPLLPATDNTDDLGSGAKRWKSLYLGTDANVDGNLNLSTGQINSNGPQCIQALGVIYTESLMGSAIEVNAPRFNAQGLENQLVFTHDSGNPTVVNSITPSAPVIYDIPDIGGNGSFVVANSSNNITVNQLNYTSLNPPVSAGFTARTYMYRKNIGSTMPAAGSELSLSFDTTIVANMAGDVTNNMGSFTLNNTGVYLVTLSVSVSAVGTNVGCGLSINGSSHRFGQSMGGSDANFNGLVSTSSFFNATAGDVLAALAYSTASSATFTAGGTGPASCFISIVRYS